MNVLVEAGYEGYISSEWEGHAYTDAASGYDLCRAQHDLCRRLQPRGQCCERRRILPAARVGALRVQIVVLHVDQQQRSRGRLKAGCGHDFLGATVR